MGTAPSARSSWFSPALWRTNVPVGRGFSWRIGRGLQRGRQTDLYRFVDPMQSQVLLREPTCQSLHISSWCAVGVFTKILPCVRARDGCTLCWSCPKRGRTFLVDFMNSPRNDIAGVRSNPHRLEFLERRSRGTDGRGSIQSLPLGVSEAFKLTFVSFSSSLG